MLSFALVIDPGSANITVGSLSNFDVYNERGQETHGFEIELDGLPSADVTYTFGAPYERYGNPKLVARRDERTLARTIHEHRTCERTGGTERAP